MKSITLTAFFILVLSSNSFGQGTKSTLENTVHNFLLKKFNSTFLDILTYVGNVDIETATKRTTGGYYLEGVFDYKNALDIKQTRKFKTYIKIFLDEYAVEKFEFWWYNITQEKYEWYEIKTGSR
jgi:hypothetical protein